MIKIEEHSIVIHELTVSIPEVRAYLARQAARVGDGLALEDCVRRCLHLGVLALEKADAAGSVDFIRQEVEVAMQRLKQELIGKIGTGEGQVLHPIQRKVDEVRQLLAQDLDPHHPESALARIRAILDPSHTESIQSRLHEAIESLADRNKPLAASLRNLLKEALEPIQESLAALGKEQTLREDSPLKGFVFEDEVEEMLGKWAQYTRAQVERISGENETGDFIVLMEDPSTPDRPFKVAIEAKHEAKPRGRKKLADDVREVFEAQSADAVIWVSKTSAGLAQEIGEWAEGRNDDGRRWTACTIEHLLSALRYAWILWRLDEIREDRPELDLTAMREKVRDMRDAIKKFREVNLAAGEIKRQADLVLDSAEDIKGRLTKSLDKIEDDLRRSDAQGRDETESV